MAAALRPAVWSSLHLLDADNGHDVATLDMPKSDAQPEIQAAFAVAFSRDGKRLAAAGVNGTINVWDAATSKVVLTLKDQAYVATSVAFSPDGRRIVSGGFSDKTIRFWNADYGHILAAMMALGPGRLPRARRRRLVHRDARRAGKSPPHARLRKRADRGRLQVRLHARALARRDRRGGEIGHRKTLATIPPAPPESAPSFACPCGSI